MREDPKEMECGRVIGLLGKNLQVEFLRQTASAGLVVLNGDLHRLIEGAGRHWCC
jgi:hypothetical protein